MACDHDVYYCQDACQRLRLHITFLEEQKESTMTFLVHFPHWQFHPLPTQPYYIDQALVLVRVGQMPQVVDAEWWEFIVLCVMGSAPRTAIFHLSRYK